MPGSIRDNSGKWEEVTINVGRISKIRELLALLLDFIPGKAKVFHAPSAADEPGTSTLVTSDCTQMHS